MKNILFNTTRQWNCGDEFILFGVRNILNQLIKNYNSIIYNRNPDIRAQRQGIKILSVKKEHPKLEAIFNIGFKDNSLKYNTDCSFIDLAVFAGSPENFGNRNNNFYYHVKKNNIPTIYLGAGGYPSKKNLQKDIFLKSLFVSVRDKKLLEDPLYKQINAKYLPCPALLSASREKQIKEVKNIALVFGVPLKYCVQHNCISQATFDFICKLYKKLIQDFSDKYKFSIVCHYIDEMPLAHKLFDREKTEIFYSYDAKEYESIYSKFDFVISSRVHGCGMASSLGIPNINISHDFRSTTCDGFLSDYLYLDTDIASAIKLIEKNIANAPQKSAEIIKHKAETLKQYVKYLSNIPAIRK